MEVVSAEANALMSDRLEMKIQMNVSCETRRRESIDVVSEVREGEAIRRSPGIIICWPEQDENAWMIGKRYGIPADGLIDIAQEKPVILKNG